MVKRFESERISFLNCLTFAGVAQSVEQLIRNQQVSGSSPLTSSIKNTNVFVSVFLIYSYGLEWGENRF